MDGAPKYRSLRSPHDWIVESIIALFWEDSLTIHFTPESQMAPLLVCLVPVRCPTIAAWAGPVWTVIGPPEKAGSSSSINVPSVISGGGVLT